MMIAIGFDPDATGPGSVPRRGPATPEEIAALVDSLTASDWELRSRSTRRLIEIGEPALPALRRVAESGPLEGTWRAEEAIEEIDRRRKRAARTPLPAPPR
jgi:hypothetical protein